MYSLHWPQLPSFSPSRHDTNGETLLNWKKIVRNKSKISESEKNNAAEITRDSIRLRIQRCMDVTMMRLMGEKLVVWLRRVVNASPTVDAHNKRVSLYINLCLAVECSIIIHNTLLRLTRQGKNLNSKNENDSWIREFVRVLIRKGVICRFWRGHPCDLVYDGATIA